MSDSSHYSRNISAQSIILPTQSNPNWVKAHLLCHLDDIYALQEIETETFQRSASIHPCHSYSNQSAWKSKKAEICKKFFGCIVQACLRKCEWEQHVLTNIERKSLKQRDLCSNSTKGHDAPCIAEVVRHSFKKQARFNVRNKCKLGKSAGGKEDEKNTTKRE